MRTGKIARLPAAIRDQLNRRLENGSSASRILPWLNALPEVKAVLKEHFHSRPITAPNLSRWTHDGYRDWLHLQGSQDLSHCLTEDTATFTNNHAPLTDTLNHWIATRLALRTRRINELTETDPDAADKLLHKMTRDVVALQRAHTQARREQRHRDRLDFEQAQAREQTAADHLRWALHPDNKSRTWRGLVETYPDNFRDISDEDSDDPSEEDVDDQTDEDSDDESEQDAEAPSAKHHPKNIAPQHDDIEDESEEDYEENSDDEPGNDPASPTNASTTNHQLSSASAISHSPSAIPPDHPSPASHQPSRQAPSLPRGTINPQPPPPSLPPAVQAAIHEQLSITRTELRILRLRMGLPPDPVPSRKEAVSCL